MYDRRRLITSGVAGLLGMGLASLGIKQAVADTPTPWGSLVFIGDGGPELILPPKDEPIRYEQPAHQNVFKWVGPDDTVFVFYTYESPNSAQTVAIIYTNRLDTYRITQGYQVFPHRLIAEIGEDNFKDMLREFQLNFERDYYAGLDKPKRQW